MALNRIQIAAQGGTVTVEIAFGYAQVGAYTLLLWNKAGTANKKLGEGINTDNVPDEFSLSKPVKNNIGKILDCVATVLAPSVQPGARYRVDMIVKQNGLERGREFYEGDLQARSVSIRLAAQLDAL